MSGVRALLLLVAALVVQAGLGRLFPGSHRWIDVMLIPVVLYGVGSSQRAAMFMGCAAGLLSDTWFHGEPFGLHGFRWTLLGWAVGAVSGRVDLNHPAGRMVTGAVVALADSLLDVVVRGLLDAQPQVPSALAVLARVASTGLLVAAVGSMLESSRRVERPGRVP